MEDRLLRIYNEARGFRGNDMKKVRHLTVPFLWLFEAWIS